MSTHTNSRSNGKAGKKQIHRRELTGIQDYDYHQVEAQDQRIDVLNSAYNNSMDISKVQKKPPNTQKNELFVDNITQAEADGNFSLAENLAMQFHKAQGTYPTGYAYLQTFPNGNADILTEKKRLKENIWEAEGEGDLEGAEKALAEFKQFIQNLEEGMDLD